MRTRNSIALLAALAAFFMAGEAVAAPAAPVCRETSVLEELLENKYEERQVAVGLDRTGLLFRIFATEDGRTFSLVLTGPDGLSCLVTAGEDWRIIKPPDPET